MDGSQTCYAQIKKSMKIAMTIRGHVRDGLNDSRLNDYIDLLKSYGHDIDLYLHSWHESEAKKSYRTLNYDSLFAVEPAHFTDYFVGQKIQHIQIENDSDLKLYGNLEGNITNTKCPLLSWKRMWAGKFSLISHVYEKTDQDYDLVVNTRYDMFTNSICYTPIKNLLRLTVPCQGINLKYPKYYRHAKGVDNYYCGSLQNIYDTTHAFHRSLDDILLKYFSKSSFHEEIFYNYVRDHFDVLQ